MCVKPLCDLLQPADPVLWFPAAGQFMILTPECNYL